MFAFRDAPVRVSAPTSAPSAPVARAYLSVSFDQKNEAKELGARWDSVKKSWYAPNHEPALVERWGMQPVVPLEELCGEDRDYGPAFLSVDLVPRSCWCKKIQYAVAPPDRSRLEDFVVARTNRTCEMCETVVGTDCRVEVQAMWEYDTSNGAHTQRLARVMALCGACYETTHFGKASMDGRRNEAMVHLQKVAKLSPDDAKLHVDAAYAKQRERNEHTWTLDLSLLTESGLKLGEPKVFSTPFVPRQGGGGGGGSGGFRGGGGGGTTVGALRQRRAGREEAAASATLGGFAFRS